jgi:hypothetical protein
MPNNSENNEQIERAAEAGKKAAEEARRAGADMARRAGEATRSNLESGLNSCPGDQRRTSRPFRRPARS